MYIQLMIGTVVNDTRSKVRPNRNCWHNSTMRFIHIVVVASFLSLYTLPTFSESIPTNGILEVYVPSNGGATHG